MQNSLHLLCFLQFGELTNAKFVIFAVFFALRRDKKCKVAYIYCAFCNSERYKVQNSLYLLCFLQFGGVNIEKYLIYCAFCNLER